MTARNPLYPSSRSLLMCDSQVKKLLQEKEAKPQGKLSFPPAGPRLFLRTVFLPPREGTQPHARIQAVVSGQKAGSQSPHARSAGGSCAVTNLLIRTWLPCPLYLF